MPAMSLNVAVQMDPIARINVKGDSTFAMLLEAQARGHRLSYYTPDRLALLNGKLFASVEPLEVRDHGASACRLRARVPGRADRVERLCDRAGEFRFGEGAAVDQPAHLVLLP